MLKRIKNIQTNTKSTKLSLLLGALLSVTMLSSMSYAGGLNNENKAEKVKHDSLMPVIRIEPKYPAEAVDHQLSGSVLLKFDVNSDGSTSNISVITSKPQGVFESAAVKALTQWQYKEHQQGVVSGNLVQLDFMFDDQAEKIHLVEGIRVDNH